MQPPESPIHFERVAYARTQYKIALHPLNARRSTLESHGHCARLAMNGLEHTYVANADVIPTRHTVLEEPHQCLIRNLCLCVGEPIVHQSADEIYSL